MICIGNRICCPRGTGTRSSQRQLIVGPSALCPRGLLEKLFPRLGWHVVQAESVEEVRRLTCTGRCTVILAAEETASESGWLVCAKILQANRQARVVMVGPNDEEPESFSLFAGASVYVPVNSAPEVWLDAVE